MYLFTVTPIFKPYSRKLIFIISFCDNPSKKYVLKLDPYDISNGSHKDKKLTENQLLRADMPYSIALVNFYLKENNCSNVANIKLYAHKTKSVLYELADGQKAPNSEIFQNLYEFNKSYTAKEYINLGIIMNDVNSGNFIKDEKGELILIDTGHVTYKNIFRPMVVGKHFELGNLCGRSIIE